MTGIAAFLDAIKALSVQVLREEPMSRHTSFEIGGPAEVLLIPTAPDAFPRLMAAAAQAGIEPRVIGNGSNLLVPDVGIRGVTVKVGAPCAGIVREEDHVLRVQAGALMKDAAAFATSEGLSGMEGLAGIPGTVGGGVYMNAGAYGSDMKDVVRETVYCTAQGEVRTLSAAAHGFDYRQSFFKKNPGHVILETRLSLRAGDTKEIAALTEEYMQRRRDRQPLEYPSAGSVFKRPPGMFAGKLIDDCGLRGARIGGAQVSEKHAGFIINTGGATCDDVRRLIEHVQQVVYRAFGVLLECEVQFL